MARLSLSTYTCPTAELGPENPHAPLTLPYPVTAHYQGMDMPVENCLPYRLQDSYSRELNPKDHKVAILESDTLRATLLLDLGGRLWSLIHKPTGKELLYVNPVIQFANFGIRNAWFSGGIEWNVGVFGHSVFTCSPVFAGRTVAPDGTDGLRIWEYERIRGVVWQVDFWAPEGSDFLYWMPRIVNPHDETIPMYWWTCIAVTEEPGGRALAPTCKAIEPAHAMGEETIVRDLVEEPDITYPQRRELPKDTYFDIPDGERPWVAHVSENGEGVLHLSSPFLKGRKQWVWGMRHCGRRWQDWLSPGGPPYIEIQGGLAKKQSDYVPMPAKADWRWMEAFGPITGIDTTRWLAATNQVKSELITQDGFHQVEAQLQSRQLEPPSEILHDASDNGPRTLRGIGGPTPFPSKKSENARAGQAEWQRHLQSGLSSFESGDRQRAREAWELSLTRYENPWVLRNLAILDKLENNLAAAADKILQAHKLLPNEPHLIDETSKILKEAEDFEALRDFLNGLAADAPNRPRIRLAQVQLALHQGNLDEVKTYFEGECDLADIRESETTLSDLWRGLCERDPSAGDPDEPPGEWDFRMR